MKHIKYILPLVAAGALAIAYAATATNNDAKVFPAQPAAAPRAQAYATAAPLRLEGNPDGVPYGLSQVDINDRAVTIRWNNPEAVDGYFDDFEGHGDFVINSPGSIGWDYLDMDNANTYTWTATVFPNQGQKMAYIVFNPSMTSPSVADYPGIQPFSGNKMLIAFTVDGGNNDYIISPELNFDSPVYVSFRAKSYNDSYGLERVRVGYSTTGKMASDFTFVQEGDYIEVPTEWTLYQYEVPAEARYVTINCVSQEAFMLLIDDIFVGTNVVRPRVPAQTRLTGFNIYRDGVKVNDEPTVEVFYTDTVDHYGDCSYTVTALYSDGSESAHSEPLAVNVPDVRVLPFEDNFNTWTINDYDWVIPADADGNETHWTCDYYSYGLVDPCATYRYSGMKEYSQSLMTRELRALDPANTYVRFKLRHVNYNDVTGDTLSVEVTCDDGATWVAVAQIDNAQGTFEPRLMQYSLAQALTSDVFRLRFRAHGEEAMYIDYWYVDDVKIWEPVYTTATLGVQAMGVAVAHCPVTLTADHGAVIEATTDAAGVIVLDTIEVGTYTVSISREGYNPYVASWEVTAAGSNTFTAAITRPHPTVDSTAIHVDLKAEEKASRQFTLGNLGDGYYDYNITAAYTANSGNIANRWEVQRSFDASGDLQSSVAFDGENYYTASWYYLGTFFKYDAQGNFIEEFSIPGMYYKVYDLAFDGTYFYGSDNTNVIFQLDFRNKRLVKQIVIATEPSIQLTHCSYDPRSDQFWVGGFYTIGRVDRDGNVTVAFREISTDTQVAVYGSAFDNITPGGPYLWFGNQSEYGVNTIDKAVISQYNLNTRRLTGVEHPVSDVPGYKIGGVGNPNYVCGVECTTSIEDGTLSLVGILQQSPSHIFVYKLADLSSWFTFEPKAGTVDGLGEQPVTVNFDARNGEVGKTYSTTLTVATTAGTETHDVAISYTVTGAAAYPRPVNVKATSADDANVALTWAAGTGENMPVAYNVYRNGELLNEQPVADTQWTDGPLVHGNYVYTVVALYAGDNASQPSDEAAISIKVGAPYYAPLALTGTVSRNKDVSLQWLAPNYKQQSATTLRWDNGENTGAVGLSEGGYFWAGTLWDYDDLVEYRGMVIDTVSVYIEEQYTSLTLQVYRDGTRIHSQVINETPQYGAFNSFALSSPVTIEAGYEYTVAFLVSHATGMRPIGLDGSTAVAGKGNIMSNDGREWFPATYIGMDNNNFNIALHISPAATDEVQPVGYNVYRDGTKVNDTAVAGLSYTDEVTTPGTYDYTVTSVYADGGESAPSVAHSATIIDLGTPLPPVSLRADVEYNRNIALRWGFPLSGEGTFPVDVNTVHVTTTAGYPEYVSMFRGYIPGEMGIACDGEYIYTSMHNSNGTINKYTLQGDFVESFVVNSYMEGIRNLTYDGTHFYAVDSESSSIFTLDMDAHAVIDTFSISEIGRHITYIPDLDNGRGGFEVGDWETSIYVNMRGAKLGDGPSYKGAAGTAYHDGVLYAFEQGRGNSLCTLCAYDFATGALMATYDLTEYVEISPQTNASAGGMSVVKTTEGLTLLALTLQEPSNSRFIFFDLSSITGLEGYNVYRNGEKRNTEPLKFRAFSEEESTPGEYNYEIETVYINGATSARSQVAAVTIYDADICDAPTDVKARQTSYGYDVVLSMVDPTTRYVDRYESFEEGTPGAPFAATGWVNTAEAWSITDVDAFEGSHSLVAQGGNNGMLIIPVDGYTDNFSFSLIARNADDHNGNGSLRIYTSIGSSNPGDFVPLQYITTTEAWLKSSFSLPANTRYVALSNVGDYDQYIDVVAINDTEAGDIYAYDIFRDGEQINASPVSGITYTDHNLLPGTYNYQVRAYYVNSCVSELSQPVTIDVDYSNNCQQPGYLTVDRTDEGRLLTWSAPALGDAIHLQWHSGNAYDAAGLPSGGCYYAGVEWTARDLAQYSALSLSEVEFYINQIPDALFVLIYQGNDLVHRQFVPSLQQYSFNTVTLTSPIAIDSSRSLRVVIYVEHNEISVPLGYDEGPALTGKGDLYSADGVTWETLADNSIDGNWNITIGLQAYAANAAAAPARKPLQAFEPRIQATPGARLTTVPLAAPATSTANSFAGYNVYCNSELLNDSPLHTTTYLDSETHPGNYYEYQVKAIYTGCGEVGSNVVRIEASGIDAATTAGVRIFYTEGNIVATGLREGTPVVLIDANGKIIHQGITDGSHRYVIRANALPAGVYLVYAGRDNAKVIVGR